MRGEYIMNDDISISGWVGISAFIIFFSVVLGLTISVKNAPIDIDKVCDGAFVERAEARLDYLSPKDAEAATFAWEALSGITHDEMEESYPSEAAYCAEVAEFVNG